MTTEDDRSSWEAIAEGPAFWEALGRAIKTERTARGWDRRELAEASGVSYPYLSEIENGAKRASSKVLILIAGALGVSVSELLRIAETWSPSTPGRRRSRWLEERARPYAAAMSAAPAEETPRYDDDTRRRLLLRELLESLEGLETEDLERLRNLARELRA